METPLKGEQIYDFESNRRSISDTPVVLEVRRRVVAPAEGLQVGRQHVDVWVHHSRSDRMGLA